MISNIHSKLLVIFKTELRNGKTRLQCYSYYYVSNIMGRGICEKNIYSVFAQSSLRCIIVIIYVLYFIPKLTNYLLTDSVRLKKTVTVFSVADLSGLK